MGEMETSQDARGCGGLGWRQRSPAHRQGLGGDPEGGVARRVTLCGKNPNWVFLTQLLMKEL